MKILPQPSQSVNSQNPEYLLNAHSSGANNGSAISSDFITDTAESQDFPVLFPTLAEALANGYYADVAAQAGDDPYADATWPDDDPAPTPSPIPTPSPAAPILTAIQSMKPFLLQCPTCQRMAAIRPFTEAMRAIGAAHWGAILDELKPIVPREDLAVWIRDLLDIKTPTAFQPHSLTDLLNRPPKQWLIDGVIGAGDLIMLYGASGSGKTHVIIDLIFSACTAQPFARRFHVDRPLNVAYAAGEGLGGLAQRFAAVADFYSYSSRWDGSNFTFFDTIPQLTAEGANLPLFITEWKARQEAGTAQPLDILIIDTLHTATAGADENSARDMGIVLQLAKRATVELGCAVVLVHHTGKSGESERGSSALRGAMDTMIQISRISETGSKSVMRCAKSKDSEAWKEQTFDLVSHLDSVRVWWDDVADGGMDDGDKRKSETGKQILTVLASAKGELTAKQIGEAIDATPQQVNRVVARLEKSELIERSQNSRGSWCFTITADGKTALKSKLIV